MFSQIVAAGIVQPLADALYTHVRDSQHRFSAIFSDISFLIQIRNHVLQNYLIGICVHMDPFNGIFALEPSGLVCQSVVHINETIRKFIC